MISLATSKGVRNPVAEAVAKALSNSPPGACAVAVERRSYGGSITDAVVQMADGSRHAYFTGLEPDEFDVMLSELVLPTGDWHHPASPPDTGSSPSQSR